MSQNYISPDPGSTNIPVPPPLPTSSSEPLRPQPPPPDQVFASATISRAPVRYTLPPAPEEIPATEAELEATFAKEEDRKQESDGEGYRSLRPGQKGFAERLLSKYGWTKGSGLGASGEGIVKPLQVKLEKQKKKPASEGGGLATPAGRSNIIGGNQKKSEDGKFGRMSEVVVLHGMVDGMDLDAELENGEGGGLMQEIGDECAEKVCQVIFTKGILALLHSFLQLLTNTAVWSSRAGLHRSKQPRENPCICKIYKPTFRIASKLSYPRLRLDFSNPEFIVMVTNERNRR